MNNQCYECGEWFSDDQFVKFIGMCKECERKALDELYTCVREADSEFLRELVDSFHESPVKDRKG